MPKNTVQYSVKINGCNAVYYPSTKTEDSTDNSTTLSTADIQNSTESMSKSTLTFTTDIPTESSATPTTQSTTTKPSTQPSTLAPITSANCPVIARIQSARLPVEDSTTLDNCGNKTHCKQDILSPHVEDWSYIEIELDYRYNVSEVTFDLKFETLG